MSLSPVVLSFRELLFPEVDSRDDFRKRGAIARPAHRISFRKHGHRSGVLSVEATAALARYQRALARAPLAAASRVLPSRSP